MSIEFSHTATIIVGGISFCAAALQKIIPLLLKKITKAADEHDLQGRPQAMPAPFALSSCQLSDYNETTRSLIWKKRVPAEWERKRYYEPIQSFCETKR